MAEHKFAMSPGQALPLLGTALMVGCATPPKAVSTARQPPLAAAPASGIARRVDDAEVAKLEAKVAKEGGDCDDHEDLASHYEFAARDDAAYAPKQEEHLLWLARHCPRRDQQLLFHFLDAPPAVLVDAWNVQIDAHPHDAAVLGNAAALHRGFNDALALALYARAAFADPANPTWPEVRGQLLSRAAKYDCDEEAGLEAYASYRRAAELSNSSSRFNLLGILAEAAYVAGDLAAASKYAEEALARIGQEPTDWNTGNLIHGAHSTLGRVALAKGDVAKARHHLLEAGKTPGSPQLASFGPDMTLAAALFAKGENAAVSAYLDLCERFWEDGGPDLVALREEILQGKPPRAFRKPRCAEM